MKLKSRNKATAEFSMSSLTDIMFLLLLFFVINYEVADHFKLLMPNATGQKFSNKNIKLEVSSDLKYAIDGKEVAFNQIKPTLINKVENAKVDNPTVVLKVDKRVDVENLVNVMAIGNEIKVQMILATNPN